MPTRLGKEFPTPTCEPDRARFDDSSEDHCPTTAPQCDLVAQEWCGPIVAVDVETDTPSCGGRHDARADVLDAGPEMAARGRGGEPGVPSDVVRATEPASTQCPLSAFEAHRDGRSRRSELGDGVEEGVAYPRRASPPRAPYSRAGVCSLRRRRRSRALETMACRLPGRASRTLHGAAGTYFSRMCACPAPNRAERRGSRRRVRGRARSPRVDSRGRRHVDEGNAR
jgi:hypothetical protein